jgi:hypothetical protein
MTAALMLSDVCWLQGRAKVIWNHLRLWLPPPMAMVMSSGQKDHRQAELSCIRLSDSYV